MRLLVGCALALALAGCTGDAEREPVDRADTRPAAPTSSAVAAASTRPLVLAVNARRPPLALTERQARPGGRGGGTARRQRGAAGGRGWGHGLATAGRAGRPPAHHRPHRRAPAPRDGHRGGRRRRRGRTRRP